MKIKNNLKKSLLYSSFYIYIAIIFFKGNPDSEGSQYIVAYLDPGTGTMIISAVIGIFATIALGVKAFWYKIVHIFKPVNKNAALKSRDDQK